MIKVVEYKNNQRVNSVVIDKDKVVSGKLSRQKPSDYPDSYEVFLKRLVASSSNAQTLFQSGTGFKLDS